MFAEAIHFNQSLNKWNISNVKSMAIMFKGAKSFGHYPSSWVVPEGEGACLFKGTKVEQQAKQKPLKTRKIKDLDPSYHYPIPCN